MSRRRAEGQGVEIVEGEKRSRRVIRSDSINEKHNCNGGGSRGGESKVEHVAYRCGHKPFSYDSVVHEDAVVQLAFSAYLAALAYTALLDSHFVPELAPFSDYTKLFLVVA